jgi:FkbM family methyltransferase
MKLAVAATVWGPHVVPFNDRNVAGALLLYGEYSLRQCAVLYKLLRPGDVALDIGANIGATALPMMRAVGPTGRVIAFEPQAPLARVCHATLALNADSPSQFEVRQAGVGRAPGTMHVPLVDYDAEANDFGCVELVADGGTPVRILVLDHLFLPRVNLIKIDAEGMEADILAGAEQLIRRDKPVLMVENDRGAKWRGLVAQIEALGYTVYWLATLLFNPENSRGCTTDIYDPNGGSLDLLCFPTGTALPDFLTGLPLATEANATGFSFAKYKK